jgi:hypothetical protein
MAPPKIVDTYRKDKLHPAGHGYGWSKDGQWLAERVGPVMTWVIHTTNNSQVGTKFWNECTFIRDSPLVSCHDVIGKDGTIAEILPPSMVAWHAGTALVQFGNMWSGGTEIHCSVGEKPTWAQLDALSWRMRQLIAKYGLKASDIETHRKIALPAGRKSDPEGWPDAEFYKWRDSLFLPVEPDWLEEWGIAYPYFKESGIAAAWRDSYRKGKPLGKAVTNEFSVESGTVRAFQRGYVTWHPTAGTKVSDW